MARWDWCKSKPKQLLRKTIHEKDNFTCVKCGWRPDDIPSNYDGANAVSGGSKWLEVDHIIPLSIGGTNDLTNLQTLCNKCNCKKGVK